MMSKIKNKIEIQFKDILFCLKKITDIIKLIGNKFIATIGCTIIAGARNNIEKLILLLNKKAQDIIKKNIAIPCASAKLLIKLHPGVIGIGFEKPE